MGMKDVNLFFACDDGYIPFLAVTLTSIKAHASKERIYRSVILNTGIGEFYKKRITEALADEKFIIEFVDISVAVDKIRERLHTRDYYSASTYYRLFISTLYPELEKALYLDCDIALCADVAELYDTELEDNLVGAVPDGSVGCVPEFQRYVENRIGVSSYRYYFNAGVLLMNLRAMRENDFEQKFINLLDKVKFNVAQDQDYLNAICSGKCKTIGCEWNCMPGFYTSGAQKKLIHYNLDFKPWHRDDVEFSDVFWHYSSLCCFADEIKEIKKNYVEDERRANETKRLILLAGDQASDDKENLKIKRKIESIWK
jgi:lipopolysaccharide biosynthesis glycosyltransferase